MSCITEEIEKLESIGKTGKVQKLFKVSSDHLLVFKYIIFF